MGPVGPGCTVKFQCLLGEDAATARQRVRQVSIHGGELSAIVTFGACCLHPPGGCLHFQYMLPCRLWCIRPQCSCCLESMSRLMLLSPYMCSSHSARAACCCYNVFCRRSLALHQCAARVWSSETFVEQVACTVPQLQVTAEARRQTELVLQQTAHRYW
jgi:hypothetical protein